MSKASVWAAGVAVLVGSAVLPAESTAQALSDQIARAPDGWARFTYAAREGVCGNRTRVSSEGSSAEAGRDRCEESPVRIEVRVRSGSVDNLDVDVGGDWNRRSGAVTDLGEVAPESAVDFLFELVESARPDVAEDAVFPATIARGVETWPRLLDVARGNRPTNVRRQAVFWLSQEASDRATVGLVSIIEDEGELEVREHAIFALSQRREAEAVDALIGVARSNPEPELKRRAIFWLGQRGDDPRVLALLEEILTSGG